MAPIPGEGGWRPATVAAEVLGQVQGILNLSAVELEDLLSYGGK